jgi:hypothetical protein
VNFKLDLKPGQEQQQQKHQLFLEHCNQTMRNHPAFFVLQGKKGIRKRNHPEKQQVIYEHYNLKSKVC